MTTQEVANRLVELCRKGQFTEAIEELFADDAISIEGEHAPQPRTEGKANILKKGEQFSSMVDEWHGGEVSAPVVSSDFFSVMMSMDITYKGKERTQEDEICVYQVKDGKIVSEQFFYSTDM